MRERHCTNKSKKTAQKKKKICEIVFGFENKNSLSCCFFYGLSEKLKWV